MYHLYDEKLGPVVQSLKLDLDLFVSHNRN